MTDDEWNDAISKWFSDPKDEYIGTFGFLLTRMSLSKNFKAVVPAMDFNSSKILRRSCHKKDSFWRNDAINVLGVAYPNVLGKLPEVYTNKEKLFRNMLYKNFTQKDFFDYKMKNYFTLKDYFYYKKIFDACGVKILNKKIFLIAFLPVSLVKMLRFLFKLKKLKLLWLLR